MLIQRVLTSVAMLGVFSVLVVKRAPCQDHGSKGAALVFPGLLAKQAREEGNPFAVLAAMQELEEQYLQSPIFASIYPEVRLNYEQFLGVPDAGPRAMQLPGLRFEPGQVNTSALKGFEPDAAIDVICRRAENTSIVIWGEEHHLPQTRSLYRPLLERLWNQGYRYLAAETFADVVMEDSFARPDYRSGYYLMDPVFATAVRTALALGYQLVAYDTKERGPEGDTGFRDRKQAQNLKERIFDRDPEAKVLVLAGRGHAAEIAPADGWTPMASVLKRLTDIDPFTIYAPTMSERLTREEEHPLYRFAVDKVHISVPTIFIDSEDTIAFGSGNCDACVFWPRVTLQDGRPDWMRTVLGRKDVPIPDPLRTSRGRRLVQAFAEGDLEAVVPIDQILVEPDQPLPVLVLPKGNFWARVVAADKTLAGPVRVEVE
jgi:hypothetical protein